MTTLLRRLLSIGSDQMGSTVSAVPQKERSNEGMHLRTGCIRTGCIRTEGLPLFHVITLQVSMNREQLKTTIQRITPNLKIN